LSDGNIFYAAHGNLTSFFVRGKRKFDLRDRLETVRCFLRFFIMKTVDTTDTAMAATIVPTKMPASAPLFKPDDTTVGNSAKRNSQ
jgi:hypothetical protein